MSYRLQHFQVLVFGGNDTCGRLWVTINYGMKIVQTTTFYGVFNVAHSRFGLYPLNFNHSYHSDNDNTKR